MHLFLILIICHFIADFVLQGNEIALNKRGVNKHMLMHGLICAIAFFVPLYYFPFGIILFSSAVIFASHVAIDAIRVEINKKMKFSPDKYHFWALLGIDQILHIGVIFILLKLVIL